MEAFFQLRKVDEERRLVYGRATQEVVDRSGEIMDYATSRPLIEAWSVETIEASKGLSKGNVRSQHKKDSTAGKVVELTFDDDSKSVDMVVKVVDDQDWRKVTEGVYTGFSLGGSYARKWSDPSLSDASGRPVTRYTAKPSEVSLVDRPCVPTAGFFDVLKADGTIEQKQFAQGENMESPEMEKGLWEAKGLITAIQDLKYLHDNIGERGKIGPELEEQIRELGRLAMSYLAAELEEHIGLPVAPIQAPEGDSEKSEEIEDLSKAARSGQKAMRKQLGEELAKCNELHKAYLDTYVKSDDAEKSDHDAAMQKSDIEDMVRRAVADAIGPALASLKKSEPAHIPSKPPVLRVLDKADDSSLQKSDGLEGLRKAAESGDTLAAIKLAHLNPSFI